MLYYFEENWYLVNYCSQEKETVVLLFLKEVRTDSTLLFSGKGNCWSSALKRTSVLLFSGEGNRWSTILKRSEN